MALALAVLAANPAVASEQTDGWVPVHQLVDSFNKGDAQTAVATCADQTSIVDEFSPYEWHGAGACSKWLDDYDADAKNKGITDGWMALGFYSFS